MDLEGKSNFIVLLLIVAFLSMTLAGLTIYLIIDNGNKASTTAGQGTAEVKALDENNRAVKKLFDKKSFNLKSTDDKKLSFIQISAEIVYDKSVKKAEEKLTAYDGEIKEMIGTYFQNMTLDEAKNAAEAKEKAKKYLVKAINDMIDADENRPIVYGINFEEWIYQ